MGVENRRGMAVAMRLIGLIPCSQLLVGKVAGVAGMPCPLEIHHGVTRRLASSSQAYKK